MSAFADGARYPCVARCSPCGHTSPGLLAALFHSGVILRPPHRVSIHRKVEIDHLALPWQCSPKHRSKVLGSEILAASFSLPILENSAVIKREIFKGCSQLLGPPADVDRLYKHSIRIPHLKRMPKPASRKEVLPIERNASGGIADGSELPPGWMKSAMTRFPDKSYRS